MKKIYLAAVFLSFFACQADKSGKQTNDLKAKVLAEKKSATLPAYKRVVVVGDEFLEMMYALGDSLKIVAVGKAHPKVAHRKLPLVGYKATLKPEIVQEQKPDAVIGDAEWITEETAEAIENLGIPCYRFAKPEKLADLNAQFKELGRILKQENTLKKWNDSLEQNIIRIEKICKTKRKDTLRVMYVQARSMGAVLTCGIGTMPDMMLRLAGVRNAMEQFDGLQPLKIDMMRAINPDYILMTRRTFNALQGAPQSLPAFATSQAYSMGRVWIIEDADIHGLNFRSGKTSYTLCKKIYQENTYTALPTQNYVPQEQDRNLKYDYEGSNPSQNKEGTTTPTPVTPQKTESDIDELKGG